MLNAIRDEDGYLYPYAKQLRLAEDKAGALTFYAPDGAPFIFLMEPDNHRRVESHIRAEFGKQATLTIKPEKRNQKKAEKSVLFTEDMFGGQEIKEI